MRNSNSFTVVSSGWSMYPLITPGIKLTFEHCNIVDIRIGDIISFVDFSKVDIGKKTLQLITHRVIWKTRNKIYTKGDNNRYVDAFVDTSIVRAYKVAEIECNITPASVASSQYQILKNILLSYSYLSLFLPFWILRGRKFFTRFFLG